jgi:hypothetical protein
MGAVEGFVYLHVVDWVNSFGKHLILEKPLLQAQGETKDSHPWCIIIQAGRFTSQN